MLLENTELKLGKRGYNVISNIFFVDEIEEVENNSGEKIEKITTISFENFDDYFEYVHGNVYENACYRFWNFPKEIVEKYRLNQEEMMIRNAFVEGTVDEWKLEFSEEEKAEYKQAKHVHKQCQKWCDKFNQCKTGEELVKVAEKYEKSKLKKTVDIKLFFYQYIFKDVENQERFKAIMEYMSTGLYPERVIRNMLCSIYDPDKVLKLYDYKGGAVSTNNKYKRRLKEYVKELKEGNVHFKSKSYYDEKTQYYCVERNGFKPIFISAVSKEIRYFETFEEFVEFLEGDLRGVDLSKAYDLDVDFTKYKMDEKTRLPINSKGTYSCVIDKEYCEDKFVVTKHWVDKYGHKVKEYSRTFCYFFDFVSFLNGDLSGADLLFCDGLNRIECWDGIDVKGVKLGSTLCKKLGIKTQKYEMNEMLLKTFPQTEICEKRTDLVLETEHIQDEDETKVFYISDLHLMHRILHAECRTKEDAVYVIHQIVNKIASEARGLLLIAGDVSSDFEMFEIFVSLLSEKTKKVIFVLGNHELWSFQGEPLNEIVEKYRKCIEKYGMILLHNELLYMDKNYQLHLMKYREVLHVKREVLYETLRSSRYVILGGMGYAGCNEEFNANQGIYRNVLDRETEKKESFNFQTIYTHTLPVLQKYNTIVLSHMPIQDWYEKRNPDENIIYVNGHSHRNYFYDDDVFRVYADNQIGYHHENIRLKSFSFDNHYDLFFDYEDGIHKISVEQYEDFYKGLNKQMTFGSKVDTLYMLKKEGYYCFMHETKIGNLTILNGGAKKKVENHGVKYYFDHMDKMIGILQPPLYKYTKYQMKIAEIVKKLGGSGRIHGCIIDIDFLNHIYVNPFDSTIKGYYALNMIDKVVYPTIPDLLEAQCPRLYEKYENLLWGERNLLSVRGKERFSTLPQSYLETDIYKASRQIKKMQKLKYNVLTVWDDDLLYRGNRIE